MDLYFLEADQPITKRYSKDANNQLVKHPYPFVYQVTSHQELCSGIQGFERLLVQHAAQGHTLVKGALQRPLFNESRAGTTVADEKTEWLCLDLDGINGYNNVDEFLRDIGCENTDYVLQWSSSMNVESQSGLRCHVFMLLDRPTPPAMLKCWLQDLNLRTDKLRNQLELTKTYNALRWPLDITTCQNDKLLYVAPPKFGKGLKDPFPGTSRISLQLRSQRFLQLPAVVPPREAIRELSHKTINELRIKANIPKRKASNFKFDGLIEYMANPDSAVITDMKTERGFVYFNLNGGDSWAYYHAEDNPTYIHNFKGEPIYRTQDLLPEYWAQVSAKAAANAAANQYAPNASGLIYLAFRDFASGQYWNGIYDTTTDDLQLAQAKSESQLRHFMKQHGQVLGDFVPDWDMVFDPMDPTVVDPQTHRLNTFRPSEVLKVSNPPVHAAVPHITHKVIDHVLAHDPLTYDHFMNWLAVIVQTMDRTNTAWVLHGTQGTGKGLLFHNILSPLFGEWNCTAKRMEELEGDFTGFLKDCFIMFADEVEAGKSLYHAKVTAKLKNLIVEPQISIREMYRPAYMHRNRVNMIFASNKNAPVEVDPDDRRFNVAPRQEQPLQITVKEVEQLEAELPLFYAYLKHYPADPARARTPLINSARSTLIDTNQLAIDVVTQAILQGDIEKLWDYLPSQKPVMGELGMRDSVYQAFRRVLIDHVSNNHGTISRDELHAICEWCVGGMPISPNKFTSLLKHHRIHLKAVWRNNRTVRGIDIAWFKEPVWHANALNEIATNAI
jgi:hypothetical protein